MHETQKILHDYLSGLLAQDLPQIDIKPGDPQLAALAQFCEGKLGVLPERQIVDFGSGRGILAKIVDDVWKDAILPRYIAVDLPVSLEALSLPRRVHNRSQKVTVDEFFQDFLPKSGTSIAAVVIRNVLHELKISETASLFWKLACYLPPDSEIYVQDMVNLPRAERGCAGWSPDILARVLRGLGQDVSYFSQNSYAGTNWFALTIKPIFMSIPLESVEDAFAEGRRKQHDELAELAGRLVDSEDFDAARLTSLSFDIGSIAAQIQRHQRSRGKSGVGYNTAFLDDLSVPIVSPETFAPYEHADRVEGLASKNSGLVALLSHKRLLDFGALLRSANDRILMMGYSQRSLFHDPANFEILLEAARRGVFVRLLVARPDGFAVKMRAAEPVYANAEELPADIYSTIAGAKLLDRYLQEELGEERASEIFSVRLFEGVPHASYFVVDDLCFVSLYSRRLSGSRGFCLVFRHLASAPTGYFDALLQDFEEAWSQGEVLIPS